ncbi:MAG TPA: insulinase family protein, partial [Kofleriaceae bacterium]|nr:insulinase family protein [Kofleriaceae bacterium]
GLERLVIAGTYNQDAIERVQKHMHAQFTPRSRQDTEFERQQLIALYGADHPYARTGVIGPGAMDQVHLDALNQFRRTHYTAGNATLVVVGDFEPAAIERQVRDSFGGWDRGAVGPPVARAAAAERTGPAVIGVIGSEGPELRLAIAYPAPAGTDDQAAARAVLVEMLNLRAGALRFKLGSTYGVYARRTAQIGPNAYELGGEVDAERAGESIKAMRDGVARLRRGDQFAQDFVRARRTVVSRLLDESTVTSELAARLGTIAIHELPPDHDRTLVQRAAAVTPAQVQALIRQELEPAREVVVVLGDRSHLERAFADAGITGARLVEPGK